MHWWWWKISKIYSGKCHYHTHTRTHGIYDDNCGGGLKKSPSLAHFNHHTMPSNILKIYVKCTRQCRGQQDKANH